ncbi:hypothetical protein RQP46_001711 [Phenoliferia psychrophenolica]
MLESSDTTPAPGQPQIATFAPELIDEILHHLVVDLTHPHKPASHPGPKSLGPYALISRVWRGPVQRRLFRRLVVKSGTQVKRIARGLATSVLRFDVHILSFDFNSEVDYLLNHSHVPTAAQVNAEDGITRDLFLRILPVFPDVVSVHLKPTFTHFRSSDLLILESCTLLARLSELRVELWFGNVELIRDLLVLTPELSNLSLISEQSLPLTFIRKPPVTLPRLRSLELIGSSFASVFVDLALVSTSTIAQINTLTFEDYRCRSSSALFLLELMGTSLKTLSYTTYDDNRDYVPELQQCLAVERITLNFFNRTAKGLLTHLPSTIHTITVPCIEVAHSDDDEVRKAIERME